MAKKNMNSVLVRIQLRGRTITVQVRGWLAVIAVAAIVMLLLTVRAAS